MVKDTVTDLANIFSTDQRLSLIETLVRYGRETTHKIFVLTIPGLKGQSIESFSIRVSNELENKYQGFNKYVLIILALDDREIRIVSGSGLSHIITNNLASRVMSESMIPAFRKGDYPGGLETSVRLIMKEIDSKVPSALSSDRFIWPIGAQNISSGHYGSCRDQESDPGCFWLSDTSTNQEIIWRDTQPFQKYCYHSENIQGRHLGADYNIGYNDNDEGEYVYAAGNGEISYVDKKPSWGNIIYIKHKTSFGIYTSMYAHVVFLKKGPPLKKGTRVNRGEPIAKIGIVKWDCGKKEDCRWPAHLHFEIRKGVDTYHGRGYTSCKNANDTSEECIIVNKGPQGQIDPNVFISSHR